MQLHSDKELFRQMVLFTSETLNIDAGIIEKDYYVTLFLKKLVAKQPQIIFKGGTSLSKCYKLIKRFSEDIALSLESELHPTEGQRKRLKEAIVDTIENLDFTLTNAEKIRSRRDYNKYIIDFLSVFNSDVLKRYLVVETSVFLRAYPTQQLLATSLIYDCLRQHKRDDLISQFELEPFFVNVQSLKRTFIDKLFALGDYYLNGKIIEHSRHIYDLYKLRNAVVMDENLRELFKEVRIERSLHPTCVSAAEGVSLREVLQKIIDEKTYKRDYESITEGLLFEKVSYDRAIKSLQEIVNSDFWD